jgi:hypothetical protein
MIQNIKPAIESEQTRNITDPAVQVMALRVEFHTGDVRMAGTDANVFLRIGERTFQIPVEYGKNPFERGAKDAFVFTVDPPMPLAELRASTIDVYHDSEGQNPGWFIQAVRLWVSLSNAPGQGLLYKEWQDVGWLAIDEKPATIKVTLQEAPH